MFGIDSSELLIISVITIVVVGPKELPRVLYKIGQVMGKIRGFTQHFRTGIDAMVREVELEELEKKWAADNKRIMEQHGAGADVSDPSTAALAAEDSGMADFPTPESSPVADDAPTLPFETLDDLAGAKPVARKRKPRPEAAV